MFWHANHIADIEIPYGVTGIEEDAFHGCSTTALTLPETVQYVRKSAYDNALNLAYVKFLNPNCDISMEQGYPYIRIIYGYDGSTAEKAAEKWEGRQTKSGRKDAEKATVGRF